MSNDFTEIKKRIIDEEKFEELLHAMGCENVKRRSNRYEAMLPSKFDSDSERSVQCYHNNENIPCRIRSRGVSSGIDIFGLVSYIVYDCFSEEEQTKNLPKAKRFICETLGFHEFLNGTAYVKPVTDEVLGWLKDVRRKRNKKKLNEHENDVLDDDILDQYIMYPHQLYIDEGVKYETQVEFQVGFDVQSERIIFPIHNSCGEIVSVKGRILDPKWKEKGLFKFIYLYNFNKMLEWYNWHRSLYYILKQKEVIIFEGEKTCWLASQFNFRNCVAISGDDISPFQVEAIKKLGSEIRIIIALDKDKSDDAFKKQGRKFGVTRSVYALWDANNLLSKETKDSPTDKGEEVFRKLYNDRLKYRIV